MDLIGNGASAPSNISKFSTSKKVQNLIFNICTNFLDGAKSTISNLT